ncbi:PIN domain-containing protein [Thermoleptolyngbya sp.]
MSLTPPVLLVLDISALASSTPKEWIEFSRIGETFVPQAVYEEMRLLFDRSPDPDLEELCKSFNHFYPRSGWTITEAHAHHPSLAAARQALTRRARITLASARCAYALALSSPGHLAILVTNDQSSLQRIYQLPSTNLCAIRTSELLQWCRAGQRPVMVSQKMQQLRTTSDMATAIATRGGPVQTGPNRVHPGTLNTSSQFAKRSLPESPSMTARRYAIPRQTRSSRSRVRADNSLPDWITQLLSLALAFGGLALAVWIMWSVIHNTEWLAPLRQPLDPTQPAPQPTSP